MSLPDVVVVGLLVRRRRRRRIALVGVVGIGIESAPVVLGGACPVVELSRRTSEGLGKETTTGEWVTGWMDESE